MDTFENIRTPVTQQLATDTVQTQSADGYRVSQLGADTHKHRTLLLCTFALLALLTACGDKESAQESAPATTERPTAPVIQQPAVSAPEKESLAPTDIFWNSLASLCGNQYGGQLTIGTEESDRDIGYAELTMDAKRCTTNEIDIGFSVDDDHSRTWMFRRSDDGFSLHHQHLDNSGKPDATSGYGGYTADEGTAIRQEFPADNQTGELIPAAATNVWAVEVVPDKLFAYELQRVEEQRMFRVVFDLSNQLE